MFNIFDIVTVPNILKYICPRPTFVDKTIFDIYGRNYPENTLYTGSFVITFISLQNKNTSEINFQEIKDFIIQTRVIMRHNKVV